LAAAAPASSDSSRNIPDEHKIWRHKRGSKVSGAKGQAWQGAKPGLGIPRGTLLCCDMDMEMEVQASARRVGERFGGRLDTQGSCFDLYTAIKIIVKPAYHVTEFPDIIDQP